MWYWKIGINQDAYECYVTKGEKYPSAYSESKDPKAKIADVDLSDLIDNPNVENVTKKFHDIIRFSVVLYIIFDSYLFTIGVRYYNKQLVTQEGTG